MASVRDGSPRSSCRRSAGLTGDDCGARAVAVSEHSQQVLALRFRERREASVQFSSGARFTPLERYGGLSASRRSELRGATGSRSDSLGRPAM